MTSKQPLSGRGTGFPLWQTLIYTRQSQQRLPMPTWQLGIICSFIFLTSLCIRVLIDYYLETYKTFEWSETLNIASMLADHGAFAGAYGNTGPSAHSSPLYPLLLSICYRAFSTDQLSRLLIASIISTVLISLSFGLLPVLAKVTRMPVRVGILAGFLGAVLPVNHWVQTRGVFEYSLSALIVIVFSIIVVRCWVRRDFSVKWAVWSGFASGVMLLTVPPFASSMVFLAIAGYYVMRPVVRKKYVRFTAIQFCIALGLLLPWMVRNEVVLGSPIWARSNTGLELYLSNNDRASALWDRDLNHSLHPYIVPSEKQHVRLLGEVGYNREKMLQATTWISNHPGRFASLTAKRIFLFWFPKMATRMQRRATALLTFLAFWGFAWLWRTDTVTSRFFLVLTISYSLPLSLFQSSERLRAPIDWCFYFFAAYLTWRLAQKRIALVYKSGWCEYAAPFRLE